MAKRYVLTYFNPIYGDSYLTICNGDLVFTHNKVGIIQFTSISSAQKMVYSNFSSVRGGVKPQIITLDNEFCTIDKTDS